MCTLNYSKYYTCKLVQSPLSITEQIKVALFILVVNKNIQIWGVSGSLHKLLFNEADRLDKDQDFCWN